MPFVHRLRQNQRMHPKELSNEDVSAEILLLMVAAPDTTSALVCATIESIVSSHSVHARVMHEINLSASQGNLRLPIASFTQMKKLRYFTACVYEAARLFPPAAIILPRKVSPGGIVLDGRFIPEGVSIGASPSVINRDPCVFGPDVHAFDPERWLGP